MEKSPCVNFANSAGAKTCDSCYFFARDAFVLSALGLENRLGVSEFTKTTEVAHQATC